MRSQVQFALAGASVLVLASATVVHAQTAAAPAAAPADQSAELSEIVVTARRRSESLQEVPQVVNAVTSDTLSKLNITKFDDVQSVVPGLTLASNSTGYQAGASLRGVTYDVVSGSQPTVAMYMNDAPVETNFLFQSLFDIGQIEVLRGPQGTTRGVAAPSGAITVTTRKPDLSAFGGYVDTTLTDHQGRNVQGAINVPIIKDVLAIRAAGLLDQNDVDGVRSINNPLRPRSVTGAERISISFEPNDKFNANVAYQHLDKKLTSFTAVEGPGIGNDPAISPSDRVAVQDGANQVRQHTDVVTAQIDSRIFGQHLSYVGSYRNFKLSAQSPQDIGDLLPGAEVYQHNNTQSEATTHEIRLASDPAPGRFLDYTVGAFYQWVSNNGHITQPGTFLPGAFGASGGFEGVGAFNPAYQVPINIDVPSTQQETSFFGSLTAHFGPDTEMSAGVRHIIAIGDDSTVLSQGEGLIRIGGNDVTLPGAVVQSLARRQKHTPTIYNVSLSHHFSRDFLVYANTGSSWRVGPEQVGLFNAAGDPTLNSLIFLKPETSKAYEVGFKSTFLDGRARLNVALFRQKFHNLIFRTAPVPYLSTNGTSTSVATTNLTTNANAIVEGFDIDSAFQITHDWNVSAALSYSDGRVDNASIPCRDANFDGVPDAGTPTVAGFQAAGTAVATCKSNGSVSQNPLWNLTVQSEYVHEVTSGMDGFVRGLLSYYPKNNRQTAALVINNYSSVNLYAGVRSQDGAWEASLFAKNAFNTNEITDQGVDQQTLSATQTFFGANIPLNSGYVTSVSTREREVGVNLRYAFGSR